MLPLVQGCWKQATSYWETAAVELEFASDAVPGFPAYTVPACPLGLNGDPDAATALPGVCVPGAPHVFVGAPRCPVVGFWVGFCKLLAANADPPVTSKVPIARYASKLCFIWALLCRMGHPVRLS